VGPRKGESGEGQWSEEGVEGPWPVSLSESFNYGNLWAGSLPLRYSPSAALFPLMPPPPPLYMRNYNGGMEVNCFRKG